MKFLLIFIFFILGTCFGSFVNMLEYRLAVDSGLRKKIKRKNIDKKFSFCDICGSKLHWYENIPIWSWLIQKGKTRCCKKALPVTYPFIELMTGILFVGGLYFYLLNDLNLETVILSKNVISLMIACFILVILVFSFVFDLKYMLIFDLAVVLLSVLAIVLNLINQTLGLGNFVSAFVASGFLLFLYLLTKKRGMGLGDVELAFFIGLLLNWQKTIVAFYAAFITGAIWGLFLIMTRKVKVTAKVPFGPFLIFGTITAWWSGDIVLNFIYRWL